MGKRQREWQTHDAILRCGSLRVQAANAHPVKKGYVGASPRFAFAYADDIAAHTRRAEEEVELSRDGYKCGVYEVIVDYLYSGQVYRAREELQRLYLGPDLMQFRAQLEQAVNEGRPYVPASR